MPVDGVADRLTVLVVLDDGDQRAAGVIEDGVQQMQGGGIGLDPVGSEPLDGEVDQQAVNRSG